MNKIVMIAPGDLSIPAINGGAIETLSTILLDINELNKKFKFYVMQRKVYSIPSSILSKYTYSKFYQKKEYAIAKTKTYTILSGIIKSSFYKYGIYIDSFIIRIILNIIFINPKTILLEGCQHYSIILKMLFPNKNIILHVHTDILNNETNLASRIVDSCDKILCVSNFIKNRVQSIRNTDPTKSIVLLNVIDHDKFTFSETARKKKRIEYSLVEEDFVCIYCGRIDETKGVMQLIKAIEKIKNKNIKLFLVGASWFGSDNIKNEFEKQITSVINKNAKYFSVGYIDNEKLHEFYSMSDLFIFPTQCNEAAGLVLLEAISIGLPVITTRRGGVPEYAPDISIQLDINDDFIMNLKTSIMTIFDNKEYRNKMHESSIKKSLENNKYKYFDKFSKIICGGAK